MTRPQPQELPTFPATTLQGTLAIMGVASAELAVAAIVHDHVLYPDELAAQHAIDPQVAAFAADTRQLQHEVSGLRGTEAVITRHHQTVPQTITDILSADRVSISQNHLRTVALQQERPAAPVTTNELFGMFLLTTAAAGVALVIHQARRNARERRANPPAPTVATSRD